ncbi:unnamed protein product, partial [Iphiclides podalirius]
MVTRCDGNRRLNTVYKPLTKGWWSGNRRVGNGGRADNAAPEPVIDDGTAIAMIASRRHSAMWRGPNFTKNLQNT